VARGNRAALLQARWRAADLGDRGEIAEQLHAAGYCLAHPVHRAAHLIDGASSHVRVADRAPTSGGWPIYHKYLADQDVDPAKYLHLKPLTKPKNWKGDGPWVGGGDPNNPGKKPRGCSRWKYAEDLEKLVQQAKPAQYVREVRKMAHRAGQRLHFTPPYYPELQPIEKFWLHAKDPVSRDPAMRQNMTILNAHMRAGFDSLPAARTTWCSAWRKTGEAYHQYLAQQAAEEESLLLLGLQTATVAADAEAEEEAAAAEEAEELALQEAAELHEEESCDME
jgi:hypothetical protein